MASITIEQVVHVSRMGVDSACKSSFGTGTEPPL